MRRAARPLLRLPLQPHLTRFQYYIHRAFTRFIPPRSLLGHLHHALAHRRDLPLPQHLLTLLGD
ncbi:MAG: hypothetical protein Fur0043_16020 [Anaerolineales bacterium]